MDALSSFLIILPSCLFGLVFWFSTSFSFAEFKCFGSAVFWELLEASCGVRSSSCSCLILAFLSCLFFSICLFILRSRNNRPTDTANSARKNKEQVRIKIGGHAKSRACTQDVCNSVTAFLYLLDCAFCAKQGSRCTTQWTG